MAINLHFLRRLLTLKVPPKQHRKLEERVTVMVVQQPTTLKERLP